MAKKKTMPEEVVIESVDVFTNKKGKVIINNSGKSYIIVETEDGNVPVEKEKLVGQNLKIGEVVYF